MHTTSLRRVGGSIMLAVPPAMLDLLHPEVGATVGMAIDGGRLVIDLKAKPRYTVAEFLAASDYISPPAFDKVTRLPVVLPVTDGGEFGSRSRFAVPLLGARTTGVVRCDQPRVLDLLVRGARRVEALPPDLLDDVLARTITLFQ